MKTLEKLLCGFILMFGVLSLIHINSDAAGAARAPRSMYTTGLTTAVSSVTVITSIEASSGIVKPGAIYQLQMSTGATGDYLILFDSNTGTGLTTAGAILSAEIGPRYYFTSTATVTTVTFDPPVEFYKGLMIMMNAGTETVGVTYDLGRGLSGQ